MPISDGAGTEGRLDPLERLTLRVCATLDPDVAVDRAVQGLVDDCDAAFARIWLLGPGDRCENCSMAGVCHERETCLHLVSSAGISTSLDGEYGRVPLSNMKIGEIAARREGHWTNAVLQDPRVAHKDWAREHGLRCFAGCPLEADGDLFGVLAMFGRERLRGETFHRLAVFTRLTAIAISNGRRYQALAE